MNLSDLVPLFDLAHQGFPPVAAVGAFFPFLQKAKQKTIGKGTLQAINRIVHRFLEVRGVENFKVYTIAYDDHPVVLIQAEPQKKLRFSNIIEIQIKRFIRENLSIEVPAVFWRFKTDYSETPGPEQADYEFEEQPGYPQDGNHVQPAATSLRVEQARSVGEPMEQDSVFHMLPHQTLNNMHVEEVDISMGEFDEFLKGAASNQTKDKPQ